MIRLISCSFMACPALSLALLSDSYDEKWRFRRCDRQVERLLMFTRWVTMPWRSGPVSIGDHSDLSPTSTYLGDPSDGRERLGPSTSIINLYNLTHGPCRQTRKAEQKVCRVSPNVAPGGEILLLQKGGSSQQHGGCALERKTLRSPGLMWLLSLLICALAVALAFFYLDVAIAHRVYGLLRSADNLEKGFASAVLLGIESATALALICIRITRGHLSPFGEATALACLTSICAYAINENILKILFGVPNPAAVLHGSRHAFDLLTGSSSSSFPSGHMVLAGAFAGVFMRLYRASILPLSALLFTAAVLLIVGDWHFVSDVIAGTFLGVSAGLLAGELWLAHSTIFAQKNLTPVE